MNVRITWVLVAALAVSLGILIFPARDDTPLDPGASTGVPDEAPRLSIMITSVRAFGQDGAPIWTLQSPEIAYHRDGRVDFKEPQLLLLGESGFELEAQAGDGVLTPKPSGDRIELTSQVDAQMHNQRGKLEFSTQRLAITNEGKRIVAPLSILLTSASVHTSAASLLLSLEDQVLSLGSNPEERVVTHLAPGGPLP